MIFHKYDPITKIYIESVESEIQPENSVDGALPETTEFYTIAYEDGCWFSLLRPEYEFKDGMIVKKENEEVQNG